MMATRKTTTLKAATNAECPVEQLAQDQLNIIRLLDAANALKSDEFGGILQARLSANEDLASTVRATSLSGATFQIGIIASVTDDLRSLVSEDKATEAAKLEWRIRRLLYSIRAVLLQHAGLSDCNMLDNWYLGENGDPHAVLAAEASKPGGAS